MPLKKKNYGSPMASAPGTGTLPPGTYMNMAGDTRDMGRPKHTGIGMAQRKLANVRAKGLTHTGAGIALRKKLKQYGIHPDAKNVNYY